MIITSIKQIGIRNNCYSQSIGMIKYFINKLSIRGKDYTMFSEDKQIELVETRKNNSLSNSHSIFDRLFGLFDNRED